MEWACTGQLVRTVESEVGIEPTTNGDVLRKSPFSKCRATNNVFWQNAGAIEQSDCKAFQYLISMLSLRFGWRLCSL